LLVLFHSVVFIFDLHQENEEVHSKKHELYYHLLQLQKYFIFNQYPLSERYAVTKKI